MNEYYLGNLMDWGIVLDKLEAIKNEGVLDSIQDELVRILRYKINWKLVEAVLECVHEIKEPSTKLIEEVFNTAVDYQMCLDTRVMAVNSLGSLLTILKNSDEEESLKKNQLFVAMMYRLLNTPQPPIFHDAISKLIFRLQPL
ncbi:MAG TPA: hypothetical protein PLD91_19555 [Spirochaetota bacterium]|nr:hypothetical protein [Spirochaetota bacterium]